jgi:hypothetical protein
VNASSQRNEPPSQEAMSNPAPEPRIASINTSVESCRTNLTGEAPSATRMLNSLRRSALRTSNRLAIFAQTVSSTTTLAPNKIISGASKDPCIP